MKNKTNQSFVVLLLAVSVLLIFPTRVSAGCKKDASLEEAFIKSQIVVWAKVEPTIDSENLFNVKELYKVPERYRGQSQFSIRSGGIHGQNFPEGSEWIIFADVNQSEKLPRKRHT